MMLGPDPLANPELLVRRVYAYVAYRLGDGPEAEDVTSEVFERALRFRPSYDARKGEPIAWLTGIARNCIATSRRPAERELPDEQAAAGDFSEDAARRLDLAAAVRRLSEREQELIALRYGADLTARQIARLLEVRTNTVEVALHRALARLRADLGESEGSAPVAQALHAVRI